MDVDQSTPPYTTPDPPRPGGTQNKLKKALGPLAVLAAFVAKFKVAIFAALKFLPTGASMIVSMWFYALNWGWWFALGFVLLIFVHECGHLLVAKRIGLKVSAPVFIPFFGAVILLKEAPRNAWIEAQVGIGGPLLGTAGAAVCYLIYRATGLPLYGALAYTGFFINLINLVPFGFLDGGRIVTALSPWLWLVGTIIVGLLMFTSFNPALLIIIIFSLPRLISLFRKKSPEEARYYEVTPDQRWIMGGMYFGLIALLVLGMMETHVQVGQ
jgi:Zn-dependent protease